jgi:hypothetical protein
MTAARSGAAVDTVRAMVALARSTILFRLRGREAVARVTRETMADVSAGHGETREHTPEVWQAFRAVQRAKRLWPGQVRCLQTALVLHAVLRRRGIPAVVRIGVRRRETTVQGHAWVEVACWSLDDACDHDTYLALEQDPVKENQVAI